MINEQVLTKCEADVLHLKSLHASTWRDMPEDYWLMRLMQEVGELASSLAGDHDDPPEHELRQISAICLNWLERRALAETARAETEVRYGSDMQLCRIDGENEACQAEGDDD